LDRVTDDPNASSVAPLAAVSVVMGDEDAQDPSLATWKMYADPACPSAVFAPTSAVVPSPEIETEYPNAPASGPSDRVAAGAGVPLHDPSDDVWNT
jgi:hypothetical protein